jgi:hypothetical protein
MAESPQHTLQIMENQTRFDLNAAIENWQKELTSQSDLTADNRRELETHLRDTLTELQWRGLNDEESFWLARRRTGQPQQLVEEFVKANPTAVWRERVFWMLLALFLSRTLGSITTFIARAMIPASGGLPVAAEILILLSFLVPLIVAVLLGAGKMTPQFSRMMPLIEGRRRLAITAFVVIVLSSACLFFSLKIILARHGGINSVWQVLISSCLYPFITAGVLVWLMPPQNRKTPKRA